MNKLILVGNLGADPETYTTKKGVLVTTFSMCTKDSYGNEDWHKVATFNKTAQNCRDFLSKGSKVTVDGKISYSSWEDEETGKTQYRTNIIANHVGFESAAKKRQGGNNQPRSENYANQPFNDDDIPF